MRKVMGIVLMLWCVVGCGSSGNEGVIVPQGELGEALVDARLAGDLPALGAYAFDADGEVGIGAVGLRSLAHEDSVLVDDRWHLGSDTKAMTGTLAALLDESGELSLDTTLSEAFPSSSVSEGYQGVTLADLLRHRGGMPTEGQALYETVQEAGPVAAQRASLAALVLEAPPSTAPGEYAYSNVGYIVVGAAMEAAAGTSWEELLRDRVFRPLAMSSCGFGLPDIDGDVGAPWGHVGGRSLPPTPESDNPPVVGPAGTVHCSLRDWGRFAEDQLRGARGLDGLLQASSYPVIQTAPTGTAYGLGWEVSESDVGRVLEHVGSNGSFTALAVLVPDLNRGLLLVTNRDPAAETLEALNLAAADVGSYISAR